VTGPIIAPTEASPLTWPASVKRTVNPQASRFVSPTIGGSLGEIRDELRKLGAKNVIISTNLPLRKDGEPYARGLSLDVDQGAAVYWNLFRGKERIPYCLPCDKWRTLAENLHAIALTINALRAVERHGAIHVVQAFEGFKALPPAGGTIITPPNWREVFGGNWPVKSDGSPLSDAELLGVVRARFRMMMKLVHPNSATATTDESTSGRVAELTAARDAAEAELQIKSNEENAS
jgi:hypothetical protein